MRPRLLTLLLVLAAAAGCSFVLPFDQDGQPCDLNAVDDGTGEFGACLQGGQFKPTWYAVANTDGGTKCLCRRVDAGMGALPQDGGM